MDATPSVALPPDAASGVPARPPVPTRIGSRTFTWGQQTFVMGIINVTPDSFSGDGLLSDGRPSAVEEAVAQARRMVEKGADLIDVGGESTRPGHREVSVDEETQRVLPVIRAIRAALPEIPISVDTTRAAVAAAALDDGADLINDVWGVNAEDDLLRLAATRDAPIVLMHNREQARYVNVVAEVLADLARALDRALDAGVRWEQTIVDPGIGFGKTAEHNLAVLHELQLLATLGRPVLLGTSRKSTIGKVLDLPADQRLEGTLATTALGVAAGVDIIRVHDVAANARVARMADAVVRGGWTEGERTIVSDRIVLRGMEFEGRHGFSDEERADAQVIELDIELELDLRPAGTTDDLEKTVNYSRIFEICRAQVEDHSYHLLEAIGENICSDVLAHDARIESVAVDVRKPGVPIDGVLEYAGIRLERSREEAAPKPPDRTRSG